MTDFNYLPKISRRTTLKWLGTCIAGFALPQIGLAEKLIAFSPTSKGYGTDPNLNNPVVPWERIMTSQQLGLTAGLADMLLPARDVFPSPSSLGIPDFVNEWVSAPYPEQIRDRSIFLDGLVSLDKEVRSRWNKGFLEIENSEQQQLFDQLVAQWQQAKPPEARNTFFYRFRYVVAGAYYTTTEGYKDIGYLGNVPLRDYPVATDREQAILEHQFKKLGLGVSK
jgi:Gluconate 2-dehydrogenase subunit 3